MSYREEFPDFQGELYIPDGFIDDSWHNDEMPKASKVFVTKNNDEVVIIIWQNDKHYIYEMYVNDEMILSYKTNCLDFIKAIVNANTEVWH